ncbi:hypothetical protein E5288_WYG019910 [Bos mutus]|uniref:Uncharacterized protein n=1 Tax=Bos mutus TaxID=72004 RepID=A0A6B0RRL2_9CETA|nr:hypothetical protein [Bos mutus]
MSSAETKSDPYPEASGYWQGVEGEESYIWSTCKHTLSSEELSGNQPACKAQGQAATMTVSIQENLGEPEEGLPEFQSSTITYGSISNQVRRAAPVRRGEQKLCKAVDVLLIPDQIAQTCHCLQGPFSCEWKEKVNNSQRLEVRDADGYFDLQELRPVRLRANVYFHRSELETHSGLYCLFSTSTKAAIVNQCVL